MTIEVFGDNCRRCNLLRRNIELALQGSDTSIEVVYVDELQKIAEQGLLSLPGLAIDGQTRTEGRILSMKDLVQLFS